MRYSRALIERFYARCAHTLSARTDSLLRQQVNTNVYQYQVNYVLNPFFHRAHYGPSASLNASHACVVKLPV